MTQNRISLSAWCNQHQIPKATAHRRCKEFDISTAEGLTAEDARRLCIEFGVEISTDVAPIDCEIEVGNHQITLANPTLPQTYSLETLRSGEAVSFNNPLAIADQFLQAADLIQKTMASDLASREQRVDETRRAREQIQRKADELKLETRLYEIQSCGWDKTLSKETEDLKAQLAALQALGKSPPPSADG